MQLKLQTGRVVKIELTAGQLIAFSRVDESAGISTLSEIVPEVEVDGVVRPTEDLHVEDYLELYRELPALLTEMIEAKKNG